MNNNNTPSLHEMSVEQLTERVENLRRELFSLRLTAVTSHVKDISQFRKLKKEIARTLTVLHQKRMEAYSKAFVDALVSMMKESSASEQQAS